ncbi:MAG: hypothetical protein AAGA56_11615 [Myxococcota bacterium]
MAFSWRAAILAGGLLGLGVFSGCGDDTIVTSSFDVPTEIAVDPPDFLGAVPCARQAGAAQSYVVTLLLWEDATSDDTGGGGAAPVAQAPIRLSTSAPTSCAQAVGFRDLLSATGSYTAEIDVYEQAPEALEPLGGESSGARTMLADGVRVTPTWTTTCGSFPDTAVRTVADRRTFIRNCNGLESESGATSTVTVDPQAITASVGGCEAVQTLALRFDSPLIANIEDLPCDGDPVELEVVAGTRVTAQALATPAEAGASPLGTTCKADALGGVTVPLLCPSLSPFGQVRIDLRELTTDEGAACPDGVRYEVSLGDRLLTASPVPCAQPVSVGPFNAIEAQVTLDVEVRADPVLGIRCEAEVVPGALSSSACSL